LKSETVMLTACPSGVILGVKGYSFFNVVITLSEESSDFRPSSISDGTQKVTGYRVANVWLTGERGTFLEDGDLQITRELTKS
jgi:hypothetical protein